MLYFLLFIACIGYATGYTINNRSTQSHRTMEIATSGEVPAASEVKISFSHIHIYVDKVDDLATYKNLEDRLNRFNAVVTSKVQPLTIREKKEIWKSLQPTENVPNVESTFVPQNRDVVKQLIAGLGFRTTGFVETKTLRSVLVTSKDSEGVQIIVTGMKDDDNTDANISLTTKCVFDPKKFERFMNVHQNRQGIGVLAFVVNNVKAIHDRYLQLHPSLIDCYVDCTDDSVAILEVFAYYQQTETTLSENVLRLADRGTTLRFVEINALSSHRQDLQSPSCIMLGMKSCSAIFDDTSMPAYCDHWVSNVHDRTQFINTLTDTLGFTPKVDFNAGVVAAGEAQIESTVIGNASKQVCLDKKMALTDQSQVYLPINNALSSVGHVHGFLKEIGQGVQHVASRVENLVAFVQRCNEHREVTGEGFTFLRIPRSYYGILTTQALKDGVMERVPNSLSESCANNIMNCLQQSLLISKDGALDLNVDKDKIGVVLDKGITTESKQEYLTNRDDILTIISSSRYCNLYSLLGDAVSEEEYLGIVRNQILVDIQGGDLLYQIFTSNILQRVAGEEAPFFEFIQRVCSKGVLKPGCGGFGIRNFLTLFLSIEVSKAMQDVVDAREAGDGAREEYAQTMVDYFTDQMNESNPILTEISEAMTEEGECTEKLSDLGNNINTKEWEIWESKRKAAEKRKNDGNLRLMECSARYNEMMKCLRESRAR